MNYIYLDSISCDRIETVMEGELLITLRVYFYIKLPFLVTYLSVSPLVFLLVPVNCVFACFTDFPIVVLTFLIVFIVPYAGLMIFLYFPILYSLVTLMLTSVHHLIPYPLSCITLPQDLSCLKLLLNQPTSVMLVPPH